MPNINDLSFYGRFLTITKEHFVLLLEVSLISSMVTFFTSLIFFISKITMKLTKCMLFTVPVAKLMKNG